MSKSKQDPNQTTLLDQVQKPRTCERCGGTILAPTIGGVPRGSCHCKRGEQQQAERITDWSAARVKTVKQQEPQACCREVIATYEAIPGTEEAKGLHAAGLASPVALFCPQCTSRLTFVGGRWQREGDA